MSRRPEVSGGELAWPQPAGPSPVDALLAKGRPRATLSMLGPAFVAAIAYVDPGNFATNIQGGAAFCYRLLWVVAAANLMAMLIQYLSAKLGIVTEANLPELCRARFPRPEDQPRRPGLDEAEARYWPGRAAARWQ